MANGIAFAQVLEQLMEDKYRRNRAKLADKAHISPSALSQYVRGRATPSLDVLVALAEALDVSLEYLVFGNERATAPPELGFLAAHLESHIRVSQVKLGAVHDLTARIGARLGRSIQAVAREILDETATVAGMITPSDVFKLERCSNRVTVVTSDLSQEVLILQHGEEEDVAAPSIFANVVAENIREGSTYEYIIPQGAKWSQAANMLSREVIRVGELEPDRVDRQLQIFYVPNSCTPGYVVQHLWIEKLQRRAPDIFERVERFICADPRNPELGYLAYIELTNLSFQYFALINGSEIPRMLDDLSGVRKNKTRENR
jgi:transcriptional regulator with XRE-family HTH domain